MRKVKRNLMVVVIVVSLLLISCSSRENEGDTMPVVKGVTLMEINDYQLDDYREYGLWSLTIDKAELTALGMRMPLTLRVTGVGTELFEITGHKVDHTRYICFIPENIDRNAIEKGTLWSDVQREEQKETTPNIEKVIIQDDEVRNETDLYEMLLTDYITLKASESSRLYNGGVLIRPSYVKSNEENAYTLQRYYNARQVSEDHNVQNALNYLKDRTVADHNALLFFGNPNRLSVTQNGAEEIAAPDTRERLRQLGVEGENQTYTFSQDGDKVVFKILSGTLTNEDWRDAEKFILDIKGAGEDCDLLPTGESSLYEGSVTWTLNDELARNARTTAVTDFVGGDGTADNPYQIANWKHLKNVRDFMGADVHFMLTTDLSSQTDHYESYAATTVENPAGWDPIGTIDNKFAGYFSGYDGEVIHTIADLCVDRSGEDGIGLFGIIDESATITQLSLENVRVKGNDFTGGFAGASAGNIRDVSVTGQITGHNQTGGLAGGCMGNIKNVSVTGQIAGYNQTGGLVGQIYSGSISEAYAIGEVTGNENIGGFAGVLQDGTITNTYAAGEVTGTNNVGGFMGYLEGGSVTASFWDNETSRLSEGIGSGSTTGIASKTTAQMKSKATFEAAVWDFTNDWAIIAENLSISYPYLQSIPQDPAPGYDEIFAGGDGTAETPYQIANWKDLNYVRNVMGADVHFMLTTDLSSSTAYYEQYVATATTLNHAGWQPIGDINRYFTGILSGYDGEASHTIADLCIDRSGEDYIGFFGMIDALATVTQLNLENVRVKGKEYTGGLVGISAGNIKYVNVTGQITGDKYTGGLVGASSGNISHAHVTADVLGTNTVGGLIGWINFGSINKASAAGTVTVNGDSPNRGGGFVGRFLIGSISEVYATGEVTGSKNIGGFVGYLEGGSISEAYATGEVTGSENVGGFMGEFHAGTINNAYATGDATGTNNVGGFMGKFESGRVMASFWDNETSGLSKSIGSGSTTGIASQTTTEMQTKATFKDEGWDFDTIWDILPHEGDEESDPSSYPYLRAIPQSPAPGSEE